jgi:hypothetical protein
MKRMWARDARARIRPVCGGAHREIGAPFLFWKEAYADR